MQLSNQILPLQKSPICFFKPFKCPKKFIFALTNSAAPLDLALSLQSETLKSLEWNSLCQRLSPFTSTSMASSAAQTGAISIGKSLQESRALLNQTAAALAVLQSGTFDFKGIEDVSSILDSAVSGTLLTVGELSAVRRTLRAARSVFERLKDNDDSSERCLPLLEILQSCNFQVELERKIGFCIDSNLSIILDRASEELEFIRSERKRNMENLDSLLKGISNRIYQAGGIDRPFVTRRRSRLCVAVRASHKHLVPDCVILDVSGSGATYFVEPGEAVELNNVEVMLSNSEREEEIAILSLLTSEIAEADGDIRFLLDRIVEVDIAFARAGYAQNINGVCPVLTSDGSKGGFSVDIEGIKHPLLLGSSQRCLSDILESKSATSEELESQNGESISEFPVPINIKVKSGTRVVVISGPNTGGKTASMKTLGIASLMSKAGFFLPAKNSPKLPWFDLVLVDIGDHQSLEQNLSTFSGHISRIRDILEVASKESLVLIDEICSGTDPSEGVALSTSILQYISDLVSLAVVTTHYADLSLLKEKDTRFDNAAMEFSLETLQPTYQILWGSTGNSNALSIARSIGFDNNIILNAQKWVEKLKPEKQKQRKGLLYQSLVDERNRLEAQAMEAASLRAEIMELYNEISYEAEDLDNRVEGLMAKETQQVQQELAAAKSELNLVIQNFESQLRKAGPDEFNSLIKKSETAIASIVEAHRPAEIPPDDEAEANLYTPQYGEQVTVKRLGNKVVTVVEAPENEETVLVQYGKIKARVKKSDIRPIAGNKKSSAANPGSQIKIQQTLTHGIELLKCTSLPTSGRHLSKGVNLRKQSCLSTDLKSKCPEVLVWSTQGKQREPEANKGVEESYGARVQTSKNTVELRGKRVEEAALYLDMAISAAEPYSVLYVVHGMGTGAVKQRALEILGNHPRVANYEPESPMNFGCTVAYIK